MKFNPHTQRLFTDDGRLIKKLHCPFRLDWSKLGPMDDATERRCGICQHTVTDTAHRPENDLLVLMTENPSACLKVYLNQENLPLTHHDGRR